MSTRFTFDANILVYADDLSESVKRPLARRLLQRSIGADCFLTQQAVGEFLSVGRRKQIADAIEIAATYRLLYTIVPTRYQQLLDATDLAERHRKQFWDIVIVCVATDAGATVLLTEDIGNGETVAGVRIVDPFLAANATIVEDLLAA